MTTTLSRRSEAAPAAHGTNLDESAVLRRPRAPVSAHPAIQAIEADVARHGAWIAPLEEVIPAAGGAIGTEHGACRR